MSPNDHKKLTDTDERLVAVGEAAGTAAAERRHSDATRIPQPKQEHPWDNASPRSVYHCRRADAER